MKTATGLTMLLLGLGMPSISHGMYGNEVSSGSETAVSKVDSVEESSEDGRKVTLGGNLGLAVSDRFIAYPGFLVDDSTSIQPSAGLSAEHDRLGAVALGYWGNFGKNGHEHDGVASYTTPSLSLGVLGDASATLGWASITSYGATLGEANVTLALDNPLNPSVMLAQDFFDGRESNEGGRYGGIAISPSMPLGDNASIGATVTGVFNDNYFSESTGFSGVRTDPVPKAKPLSGPSPNEAK